MALSSPETLPQLSRTWTSGVLHLFILPYEGWPPCSSTPISIPLSTASSGQHMDIPGKPAKIYNHSIPLKTTEIWKNVADKSRQYHLKPHCTSTNKNGLIQQESPKPLVKCHSWLAPPLEPESHKIIADRDNIKKAPQIAIIIKFSCRFTYVLPKPRLPVHVVYINKHNRTANNQTYSSA